MASVNTFLLDTNRLYRHIKDIAIVQTAAAAAARHDEIPVGPPIVDTPERSSRLLLLYPLSFQTLNWAFLISTVPHPTLQAEKLGAQTPDLKYAELFAGVSKYSCRQPQYLASYGTGVAAEKVPKEVRITFVPYLSYYCCVQRPDSTAAAVEYKVESFPNATKKKKKYSTGSISQNSP